MQCNATKQDRCNGVLCSHHCSGAVIFVDAMSDWFYAVKRMEENQECGIVDSSTVLVLVLSSTVLVHNVQK